MAGLSQNVAKIETILEKISIEIRTVQTMIFINGDGYCHLLTGKNQLTAKNKAGFLT